jgi:hypothetical protein
MFDCRMNIMLMQLQKSRDGKYFTSSPKKLYQWSIVVLLLLVWHPILYSMLGFYPTSNIYTIHSESTLQRGRISGLQFMEIELKWISLDLRKIVRRSWSRRVEKGSKKKDHEHTKFSACMRDCSYCRGVAEWNNVCTIKNHWQKLYQCQCQTVIDRCSGCRHTVNYNNTRHFYNKKAKKGKKKKPQLFSRY